MHESIRFANNNTDFSRTLVQRVNEYFKANNKSKKGNMEMFIKTVVMFSCYFVPFFFIISGWASTSLLFYTCWFVAGVGMSGIGMSIMHDANHGAYSHKQWVNDLIGYSLYLIGGSVPNWKIQHNLLHHTYTNIEGFDEDISSRGIIRFSPNNEQWTPMCRYQHIYIWFLYGMTTLEWVFFKDFARMKGYCRTNLIKVKKSAWTIWFRLILAKIFYLSYTLALPIYVSPFSWWHVVVGFLFMHFVSGLILASVFQVAHVVNNAHYPLPDKQGNIDNEWFVHQLYTTVNFAQRKRLLSWYVGGLNFQVEHHLFANICHVHYRALEPIVKKTALEFNLPYNTQETFFGALKSHYQLLKTIGQSKRLAPLRVAEI